MRIKLEGHGTPPWQAARSYVAEGYRKHFNADVSPSPECFVTLSDHTDGKLRAASGITFGGSEPLFSERYLGQPVTLAASEFVSRPVEHGQIVEVGSFAAADNKVALELVNIMPIVAWFLGMEFILCTATLPMRGLFKLADLRFQPLAEAQADALPSAERARWGTYYVQRPVVGLIPMRECSGVFATNTGRYDFMQAFDHVFARGDLYAR